MKKSNLSSIASALILMILLSGCGNTAIPPLVPTATDTAIPTLTTTLTPDPCASDSIKAVVEKVHRHMREFDDAATLAASMPREQLSEPIANLQKIRRDAEDEKVPDCLAKLKEYQIQHMNTVIATLIAFMSVSDPLAIDCNTEDRTAEEQVICPNIAIARQLHDQYTLELARILGIPIVTATAMIPSETQTP